MLGVTPQLRARVQKRTANVYDTAFTRRVSIYLTVVLARFDTEPNYVSAIAGATGAGACLLLALGSPPYVVAGALLIHIYAVLDSVDGELARLRQKFSLVGLFIEDYSAYSMINGFNLAIGWRIYEIAETRWPLIGAVLIAAFGRNVMPVVRRAILAAVASDQFEDVRPESPNTASPSRLRLFVDENIIHPTNQWVLLSALAAAAEYRIVSASVLIWSFVPTLALFVAREILALDLVCRRNMLYEQVMRTRYVVAHRGSRKAADGGAREDEA